MTVLYILFGITACGVLYIAWAGRSSGVAGDPLLKAEIDRRTEEIGELKNMMKELNARKSKMEGETKQMWATQQKLDADLKSLMRERDALQERIAKFEAERDARERRHEEMIKKLESAEHALEDEQKRVRHEDEERQKQELEERDRMWAEHETNVIALLTDLCKKPQHSFTSYDNNNLPEGFHGNLKPDFLIGFLEQYVIFDAKISKATNLQIYIDDQVKKTAAKVKGKEGIYPRIFLVVPTDAIGELKKTYYYEDGFHFYVVSPEALAPILASLKHIEGYETTEGWDPQERESIIDLITQFDYHISLRNFAEYQLMQHGLDTLERTKNADVELAREVAIRKAKMRPLNFKTAEQKAFTANPELLREKLKELTEPQSKM
ncbi:MAG: hypothetical protein PHE68_02095 [Candidatus Peribacteraceae bacterium]|nr:hypothetical protein [Candidatus Peribacteraceae bacterium]MDD5074316.1 hypothetical protein [Candidatus Peribacteraceae bacterium]